MTQPGRIVFNNETVGCLQNETSVVNTARIERSVNQKSGSTKTYGDQS